MTVTSGRLIKEAALSTATKTTTTTTVAVMSSRKTSRDPTDEGLDHQELTLLDLAHGKKTGLSMKVAEVQQHGSVKISKTSKWPSPTAANQAETTEGVLAVIVPVAASTVVRMGTWLVSVPSPRQTGGARPINQMTGVATSVNV